MSTIEHDLNYDVYLNMLTKRIVSVSFMLLMLFTDSGQFIYAHTCNKSKHTHISLNTPKHCCGDKAANSSCGLKKSKCCEITSKYFKQSFATDTYQIKEVKETERVFYASLLFVPFTSSAFFSPLSGSSPPLLVSKKDIRFTQSFRI